MNFCKFYILLLFLIIYNEASAQRMPVVNAERQLNERLDSLRNTMLSILKNDDRYQVSIKHDLSNTMKIAAREDTILAESMKLIRAYKGKIADTLLQRHEVRSVGLCQKIKYRNLRIYLGGADTAAYADIKNAILPSFEKQFLYDDTVLIKSAGFLDFLLEKERVFSILNDGNVDPLHSYVHIRETYKEPLRSALVSKLLLSFYAKADLKEWTSLAKDALTYMESSNDRSAVEAKLNQNGLGKPAFGFILPDTNGNAVKLSDLKGKVVVIDFWFTGCSACKILAKSLKLVAATYSDNPNVVFVSISVDSNREKWIQSVRSGVYTGNETINLYTEGKGSKHPIIDFYGFSGYPNLLVIDKQSKLAAIPPRPETPESFRTFVALIDELL
ncbi:TlpA family protein disulfide reductase [Olivibacter sp. SA151]|uniref:TlpA family protein disulfide reductase n=1 Tax=Olivibacter jilunii TaxID=985016 RepID=UPI003F17A685